MDVAQQVLDSGRAVLHLLAWVLSAYALHHLALPGARAVAVAATPAWTVMP
jgi:hypothetical protein